MKSNIILIRYLCDNDLLREYAVFLRLKHVHINSMVYDFSLSKLASQAGISRNGIRKYIAFFIKEGWAIIEGNNLYFISNDKLVQKLCPTKVRSKIKIEKTNNINSIVKDLRYAILKEKERTTNYVKGIINDQSVPKSLKNYKKATAKIKKLNCSLSLTGEVNEYLRISLNTLSKLLNTSCSSVSRLIKDKRATVIRTCTVVARKINYFVELPPNHFWYKGFIVKAECNQYKF